MDVTSICTFEAPIAPRPELAAGKGDKRVTIQNEGQFSASSSSLPKWYDGVLVTELAFVRVRPGPSIMTDVSCCMD